MIPPARALDVEGELERLRASEARLRLDNERLVESQRLLEDACLRYADLYDYAPLAYVTLDGAGIMRAMNLVGAALLGSDRRALMGTALQRFVAEEDRAALHQHLGRCRRADGTITCELRVLCADGSVAPVQLWSRTSLRTADRFPSALVDLRERERAASERRALLAAERAAREASAAKDKFIAVLSHELRTPLTPVLAAVSAVRARSEMPGELRDTFEMIHRNVAAEARLIDDLLDVTRIARGKLRLERGCVDVHQVARDALEISKEPAAARRHSVEVTLAAPRHHASGDAMRLRQVLWNLLSNAVKFTPEGGRIVLRSWNEDDRLAISVSDSGIGFDSATAARVFEPFAQQDDHEPGARSSGGLGLGLAIAKGIMELHAGTIAARSEGVGRGACVVIELPTTEPPEVSGNVPCAAPAPPSTRRATVKARILLVEDHADTAMTLSELLTERGYAVRTVASIKAALAVDLAQVDLVLSDLGLPDGSGLDLMRHLRSKRPPPAIALSGYATEADVRACRDAGFAMHLAKPLEFEQLIAAIRALGIATREAPARAE